jgi:hypothetical protein
MPQRARTRLHPHLVLNSVAAAVSVLLLTAFVSVPHDDANPPRAVISVNDSSAAEQLSSQLPLTVTFNTRMGAAQFARLSEPLAINDAAVMDDYRSGDVAYFAEENSLVVFLSDGSAVPDTGLVLIGHIATDLGDLASCATDCAAEIMDATVPAR